MNKTLLPILPILKLPKPIVKHVNNTYPEAILVRNSHSTTWFTKLDMMKCEYCQKPNFRITLSQSHEV